jgi:bacterioferritin
MASGSHQVPFQKVQDGPGRNHAEYVEGESLVEMVRADLLARRISIDDCRDIIQHLHDQDAPTRQGLQGILAVKGQRAGDAENRLARIGVDMEKKKARTQSS